MKRNRETCRAEGCDRLEAARGLCMKHYQRQRKHGDTSDPVRVSDGVCHTEGCAAHALANDLCKFHYQRDLYRQRRLAAGHPEPLPEIRPCPICGAEFKGSRRQLYCSPVCATAARDARRRLADYGFSDDLYFAMLEAQGRLCAICKGDGRDARRNVLSVDHCHDTNVVRGLLCHRCNVGLGQFLDDPNLLRAAAAYLEAAQRKV